MQVLIQKHLLQGFLKDASLLHGEPCHICRPACPQADSELSTHAGLGVKLVIVLGVQPQIDALLEDRGHTSQHVGGYRITDEQAMLAAMQAAGAARMEVEAQLSKVRTAPTMPASRCLSMLCRLCALCRLQVRCTFLLHMDTRPGSCCCPNLSIKIEP